MLRADLCEEAIRLGRVIRDLLSPNPPAEATALLALMLLHDARRDTRVDDAGDIVLLADQDRDRWNQGRIAEALVLVAEAFRAGAGFYALQAAIAAEHCRAGRAADTTGGESWNCTTCSGNCSLHLWFGSIALSQ
jgi:RNA polymerase sigma-70 factor (ECF subfamily)